MLASAGWAQKDVDDAFNFVKTGRMPVLSVSELSVVSVSGQPQFVSSTKNKGFSFPIQEE
jgi:hypothetical protein